MAYPYKLGVFNKTEPNGMLIGTLKNTSTAAKQATILDYHGGSSAAEQLYGLQVVIDSGATAGSPPMNTGVSSSIVHSAAAMNSGFQTWVTNFEWSKHQSP